MRRIRSINGPPATERHPCKPLPASPWAESGGATFAPPKLLAGRGVGSSQSRIGGSPDTRHATAGADKQRSRRETYESQKQRIFDQILALFIVNKVVQQRFHGGSLLAPLNSS